ncbi:hypothetical protein BLOT_000470 [Blomia tropicalis]|nr:hypothetical protein BLOT_000470 [Blomia tropicalis]
MAGRKIPFYVWVTHQAITISNMLLTIFKIFGYASSSWDGKLIFMCLNVILSESIMVFDRIASRGHSCLLANSVMYSFAWKTFQRSASLVIIFRLPVTITLDFH